ncbi:hypothetical protein Hanom_Chr10g00872661 [Helianthus anomalus]
MKKTRENKRIFVGFDALICGSVDVAACCGGGDSAAGGGGFEAPPRLRAAMAAVTEEVLELRTSESLSLWDLFLIARSSSCHWSVWEPIIYLHVRVNRWTSLMWRRFIEFQTQPTVHKPDRKLPEWVVKKLE